VNIISNEKIDEKELENARKIIIELQKELSEKIKDGYGPFLAAIYDENGNLIAKKFNTVQRKNCSNNHAEINTIKKAEKYLKKYDLSNEKLKMYVTAEPCIMCLGAIMWSGIKELYYSVPSEKVEEITGFDEGFKPNWIDEFKKRGIKVAGNIEAELGEEVLQKYIKNGGKVYKPERK